MTATRKPLPSLSAFFFWGAPFLRQEKAAGPPIAGEGMIEDGVRGTGLPADWHFHRQEHLSRFKTCELRDETFSLKYTRVDVGLVGTFACMRVYTCLLTGTHTNPGPGVPSALSALEVGVDGKGKI